MDDNIENEAYILCRASRKKHHFTSFIDLFDNSFHLHKYEEFLCQWFSCMQIVDSFPFFTLHKKMFTPFEIVKAPSALFHYLSLKHFRHKVFSSSRVMISFICLVKSILTSTRLSVLHQADIVIITRRWDTAEKQKQWPKALVGWIKKHLCTSVDWIAKTGTHGT